MSANNATAHLKEIESIDIELNRLRESSKKLRERRNVLDAKVKDYMKKTKQSKIKSSNTFVELVESDRRKRKKKKDKESDCKSVLTKYGMVGDTKKIMGEIFEAISGDKVSVTKLEFNKKKSKSKSK